MLYLVLQACHVLIPIRGYIKFANILMVKVTSSMLVVNNDQRLKIEGLGDLMG